MPKKYYLTENRLLGTDTDIKVDAAKIEELFQRAAESGLTRKWVQEKQFGAANDVMSAEEIRMLNLTACSERQFIKEIKIRIGLARMNVLPLFNEYGVLDYAKVSAINGEAREALKFFVRLKKCEKL